MTAAIAVEFAGELAFQRRLIRDMCLILPENEGRLLTDVVGRCPHTGAPLDRGQMYDRHAVLLAVCMDGHELAR